MNKLSTEELQQLLDYNSNLRSSIILKGASEKEVNLIDFYSDLILEELDRRNAIIKFHINEVTVDGTRS